MIRGVLCVVTFSLVVCVSSVVLGDQPPEMAEYRDYVRRGEAFLKSRNYAEATEEYEKAVVIATRLFGSEHAEMVGLLRRLGHTFVAQRNPAKAEASYCRALEIAENLCGKQDARLCAILLDLGKFYHAGGRPLKAEEVFNRSKSILESSQNPDKLVLLLCLRSLADIYCETGRPGQAEPLLEQALSLAEGQFGKDSGEAALVLDSRAALYQVAGQCEKAESDARRALTIAETKYGREDGRTAMAMTTLAEVYLRMNQLERARDLCARSEVVREKALGPHIHQSAKNLACYAEVFRQMKKPRAAISMYERSVAIAEDIDGKDSLMTGILLRRLGETYAELEMFADAQRVLKRSLLIFETVLGGRHRRVAKALCDLADVYCRKGETAQAESSYRRAIDILLERQDSQDDLLADAIQNLARLRMAAGDAGESTTLYGRLIDTTRNELIAAIPQLAESEQVEYVNKFRHDLRKGLALAIRFKDHKSVLTATAEWAVNGKGIVLDVLSDRTRQVLGSCDPTVQSKFAELKAVRSRLATLAGNPLGYSDKAAYRKQLVEFLQRERELSKALGCAMGRSTSVAKWVKLSAVRDSIPPETVLVELVLFPVVNPQARIGQPSWIQWRYAAWIIPPSGREEVKFVDLGDAERLDAAAMCMHAVLASPVPPNSAKIMDRASEIITSVWEPVRAAVGKTRNLIVSPDGALWLIPWETFPTDDGKFLVETCRISYTVSGRHLLGVDRAVASSGAAVFADPDYDLEPDEGVALTRRLVGDGGAATPVTLAAAPSLSGIVSYACRRLPETADVAKAIAPNLKGMVKSDPVMYLGKQALEGVLMAVKSPKVLVLMTHGSFEDVQFPRSAATQPSRRQWEAETDMTRAVAACVSLENPLLRCGLVLASGNKRHRSTQGDDGILTGMEIVGADLRGTELVVLGACETGLGALSSGEGVASLRQAFQVAGARAVVSTLWSVPAKESCQLLTRYFENLQRGQGKAEALRNAQMVVIATLRAHRGEAPPCFWAAFTLTGDCK